MTRSQSQPEQVRILGTFHTLVLTATFVLGFFSAGNLGEPALEKLAGLLQSSESLKMLRLSLGPQKSFH